MVVMQWECGVYEKGQWKQEERASFPINSVQDWYAWTTGIINKEVKRSLPPSHARKREAKN